MDLFPDLSKEESAFDRRNQVAGEIIGQGFHVTVSTSLEDNATNEEKATGSGLADFLLEQWPEHPFEWDAQ